MLRSPVRKNDTPTTSATTTTSTTTVMASTAPIEGERVPSPVASASPALVARTAACPTTALPAKLSVLRGSRTKLRNKLESEVAQIRSHDVSTSDGRDELNALLDLVEERSTAIRAIAVKILDHPDLPEADEEKEIDANTDATDIATRALSSLRRLLSSSNHGSTAAVAIPASPQPTFSTDRHVGPAAAASAHLNVAAGAAGSFGYSAAGPTDAAQTNSSSGESSPFVNGRSSAPNAAPVDNGSSFPAGAGQWTAAPQYLVAAPPLLDVSPDVYDGDQLSYRHWKRQFENWMSRRITATGADRLVALLKLLRGPPRDLVKCLEINDSNYDVALQLLESNYGHVDVERKRLLANINNVPIVRSANDVQGLRHWLNHVQSSILSLQGIGIPLAQYALTFESTISSAIPDRLLFDYQDCRRRDLQMQPNAGSCAGARSLNEQAGDAAAEQIEGIIEFIRRYTCHKEESTAINPPLRPMRNMTHGQLPSNHQHQQHRQSSSRQASNIQGRHPPFKNNRSTVLPIVQPRKPRPCLFCQVETHTSSRCDAALSYQQRCQIVDKLNKCRTCFRQKHNENSECRGTFVECKVCKEKTHYTSMHPSARRSSSTGQTLAATMAQPIASVTPTQALVPMCSAYIVHDSSRIPVRVFLDPGSTLTFVTSATVKSLVGLSPLCQADLSIQAFASSHKITARRYCIRLVSTYDDQARVDVSAYEHDFGVNPSNDCSADVLESILQFGRTHPLADRTLTGDLPESAPALLIGIDQYYKITHLGREKVVTEGLVAKDSRFGWVVSGPITHPSHRAEVTNVYSVCCAATLSKAARDVERLWSLEAIGIREPSSAAITGDDASAVRQFNEQLNYDGHSYTVGIPKRASIRALPNNEDVALRRLHSKRRSLARDPAIFERYHREVMSFITEGHAEEVAYDDRSNPGDCDGTYYMPHRQVVTQANGKVKWRIVFDCSSSAPRRTSLNSHLLPGPNLNPDLVALLLNFRLHKVAVSADIARAYLMINVAEADRPLFRFLWQGPNDDRVRCFQMKKVTWGASPSAFLLAATLRNLFRRVDPTSTYQLDGSFYHDDMLRSFACDEEAVAFIEKVIPWLGSGDMRLAKWKTNSTEVTTYLCSQGAISDDNIAVEADFLKVLGMVWSPGEDQFRFVLSELVQEAQRITRVTKRAILRVVASIFDPLGWLLPYSLRGKHLIQQLWTSKLKWDDTVDEAALTAFKLWMSELDELSVLRVPRQCGTGEKAATAYHLHLFGDASTTAYAAVAYLQQHCEDGTSHCSLIMAKSRLAPRDPPTVPRLELLAALLTVRLRQFLLERLAVKVDRVFHYTDSTVAYFWSTGEDPLRWKTFVSNRVAEIRQHSTSEEWFHVPGPQNVADLATRGVSAAALASCPEWWVGPTWLRLPEPDRPTTQPRPENSTTFTEADSERRAVVAPIVQATPLIDVRRSSSLKSAVRVVANVLRFVSRCRRQPVPGDAELRNEAERRLIQWAQSSHFADELAAVKAGERPPRSSKLASFALFIDEHGLLRAKTRLTKGPHFTYDEANPIVIPGESRLAALLVLHHHRINAHFGVSVILAAIRRRFWVTRARQIIRSLLRRCVVCRKSHGLSADQVQGPLPPERTSLVVPFATAGLDFCGPFYIRSKDGTSKSYIALFTCASIRAVHLELVPSMSTPQTHLALRRFMSSHPGCSKLISDNARSFVKAASDIKRLFNSMKDPESREALAEGRIEWFFNCPRAPWRGGFFERLVGTVKSALVKTLGRSLVGYEELRTIISELAAVINDRPISYVESDPDAPLPLTPSQFLHGGPVPSALCSRLPLDSLGPNGATSEKIPIGEDLRTAHLRRTQYFKAISVRWSREYMLMLRTANTNCAGQPRTLELGDVCLVKDDNRPRVKWNLARVMEAHPGRDGAVRTYSVKFANGHVTRRPAQLLYPLEVV